MCQGIGFLGKSLSEFQTLDMSVFGGEEYPYNGRPAFWSQRVEVEAIVTFMPLPQATASQYSTQALPV